MEEEGHVCEAPWDHGVGQWDRTLMPCVWWCVVPAGFASGRGYLAAGDPIWSGKSPTGTMLAFYWTFLLLFLYCFFSRFTREGLCTNNQKVKCAVPHNLPKALKQLKSIVSKCI